VVVVVVLVHGPRCNLVPPICALLGRFAKCQRVLVLALYYALLELGVPSRLELCATYLSLLSRSMMPNLSYIFTVLFTFQVAKNRFDGELGIMLLKFDKETLSFAVKSATKDDRSNTS